MVGLETIDSAQHEGVLRYSDFFVVFSACISL